MRTALRHAARSLALAAALGLGPSSRGVAAPTPRSAPPVSAALTTGAAPVAAPPTIEHVIVISEDGLRPDALDERRTPNHVAFMHAGARARIARTIHESDTLPSHASMLSGFDAPAHGLWWNSYRPGSGFIHVPTVFSIAKAHGLSTAMIVGKPKLRHIAIPGSVDHLERPSYLCGGVSRRAAEWFASARPNLMFVHFSDPDEYGHAKGWMSPEYLRGVQASDRCLGALMDALAATGMMDRTLVIVTADHGGHSKIHSGSRMEVDRQIPWMERGPGVRPGSIIDGPVVTVDTAATVLMALGLPLPAHIAGTPITD